MNTLKNSTIVNSPDPDTMARKEPVVQAKMKTPLRKDELEKIARELKSKLARASETAKQLRLASSSNLKSLQALPVPLQKDIRLSPMKSRYLWKRQPQTGSGLNLAPPLALLNSFYSPDRKLPTLTTPLVFLLSLPLKNISEHEETNTRRLSVDADQLEDSPIRKRRSVGAMGSPTMILEKIKITPSPSRHENGSSTAAKAGQAGQTTPTLQKRQLAVLKTPTQLKDAYNDDEEGADLLMYLATSPSPAKPYANTPRASLAPHGSLNHASAIKPASAQAFAVPPPPLTPKRPMFALARTPQNRHTPGMHGNLALPGSALPSAGLALTPAGFNMSDYVNFFTPSPSAGLLGHGVQRNLALKNTEFHLNGKAPVVDGKMINFDGVGLFGHGEQKE